MTASRTKRLRLVEEALKEGRLPRILKPLPGVENLLRSYGLEPNVDIFVPQPGMTPAEGEELKRKIRYRRQYINTLKGVREYKSREQRQREAADARLQRLTQRQKS